MGQYHLIVNLDRREFLDPHALGVGLKAWEQIANHPSTPQALFVLLTCSSGRGGGDFAPDQSVDHERIIGRWAGDRIAVIGDYAEDGDIEHAPPDPVSTIYGLCRDGVYRDVSALVRPRLAAELGVRYVAEPWTLRLLDGTVTRHESWSVLHDPSAPFSILDPEPTLKERKRSHRDGGKRSP